MKPNNLDDAVDKVGRNSRAWIVAVMPSDPDQPVSLEYRGNLHQLKAMFRYIRDTLRTKEHIGNHPKRHDVRGERRPNNK